VTNVTGGPFIFWTWTHHSPFWAARLLRAKETTSCLWAKKKKMRLAAPEVQA